MYKHEWHTHYTMTHLRAQRRSLSQAEIIWTSARGDSHHSAGVSSDRFVCKSGRAPHRSCGTGGPAPRADYQRPLTHIGEQTAPARAHLSDAQA